MWFVPDVVLFMSMAKMKIGELKIRVVHVIMDLWQATTTQLVMYNIALNPCIATSITELTADVHVLTVFITAFGHRVSESIGFADSIVQTIGTYVVCHVLRKLSVVRTLNSILVVTSTIRMAADIVRKGSWKIYRIHPRNGKWIAPVNGSDATFRINDILQIWECRMPNMLTTREVQHMTRVLDRVNG